MTVNGVWGGYHHTVVRCIVIVNDNNRGAVCIGVLATQTLPLSVFIDDFPTPTGNRQMASSLATVAYVANTFGVDSLWALSNPIDPTSAVKIGNFPELRKTYVLMAEVELQA